MLRCFIAFLGVFSLLSLLVHLNAMSIVFGGSAAALFVIDVARARISRTSRAAKMHGEPVL